MSTASRAFAGSGPGAGRHVLAAAASGVGRFIQREGGNASAVLARVGLHEHGIDDPLAPLDLGAYCRLMELAAADTGDDNFGLRYGQQFQPEQLGLIGQIAISAPTLGSALEHLATLFPFHQQVTETAFREQHGVLSLEYRILDGSILQRRQDAELTLGMFANVLRRCLGPDWVPDEVWFEHPRPGLWREHGEAFGSPVRFAQTRNALRFRQRDLQKAMPDRDLQGLVQRREQLLELAGDTGQLGFVDRLRGEIRSRLVGGYPAIEDLAQAMGLARWTLQRRLAEHGLNYAELVDGLRRHLAMQYLAQPHLPLQDLAALLGYSELSAFSRACVRWFGMAPTRFRRGLGGAGTRFHELPPEP